MDFSEAWNVFKTESEMASDEYRQARFGVKILFDINDYLKGRISIKSKTGQAYIRGRTHKLEDFETELEVRERIIKGWLLDNYGEEDVVNPRGVRGILDAKD